MENKRVKQMICDVLNKKYKQERPCGFFFHRGELKIAYIGGYPPDGFYEDCEKCNHGTISLTANQLKGK